VAWTFTTGHREQTAEDGSTEVAPPPSLARVDLVRTSNHRFSIMSERSYTAIVEKDSETGLLVGYVPGIAGAHSQAESLDELRQNLREVLAMLLEDGEPVAEAEFVGTQQIRIA